MAYAQTADLEARYPNRDLVQLSNEDPSAQTVNSVVLAQALGDASAEIDAYLEARFDLPLTDPPALLNRIACDIAIYRLQSLRPIHDLADARKRYDDAISALSKVASGELTLGLAADAREPAAAPETVLTEAGGDTSGVLPQRVFSRGSLKGF